MTLFSFWKRAPQSDQGPLYHQVDSIMKDVRAYARSHGGDIALVSVSDDGDVTVRLNGACKHCPLSAVTLREGVERRLQEAAPGVRRVIAV